MPHKEIRAHACSCGHKKSIEHEFEAVRNRYLRDLENLRSKYYPQMERLAHQFYSDVRDTSTRGTE